MSSFRFATFKNVFSHHHTTYCKKKSFTCRFGAPRPPLSKTLIVRGTEVQDKVSESKKVIRLGLSEVAKIDDLKQSC